ncbi:MAG: zinc ribbon domain-containing protein, partial [Candidatus Melainabacteria bacterium]|nr:zinc ribbon domain-containing protein [Candidatus Melainabacteria bacterium]
PGISDHYDAKGFGIFPSTWNRIHSQQVVARVDPDSIKRMEKHHALVYLSPAGDAEFGETKPFMCDLRGIEEIAKLHLLHNVTGRSVAASEPEVSTSQAAMPMSDDVVVPGSVVSAAVASGSSSGSTSVRLCPHCGQPAGKGRFCIECGRPLTGIQPGQLTQAMHSPTQTLQSPTHPTVPSGPRETLPAFVQPTHQSMSVDTAPGEVETLAPTSMGGTTDNSVTSGLSPYSAGAGDTQRAVLAGQAFPPAAGVKQRVPMPPQVVPPVGTTVPAMPPSAGQITPQGQRPPVTSLIADPAKLGIQHGRQAVDIPVNQAETSVGGVEF